MYNINVLHINTSGLGGAAIACHRLHHLMLDSGIKSNVLHLYDNAENCDTYYTLGYSKIRRVTNRLLRQLSTGDLLPEAYVFNEFAPLSSNIAKHSLVKNADVIYLHWVVGGFLSKSDFIDLAKLGKPIFCFTHDMWWITGGCHYAFDCQDYKTGCKHCHLRKSLFFLSHNQLAWKRDFYNKYKNIYLISPSVWLKHCIEESFVFLQERCTSIPNVVPDSIFRKIDKKQAREKLGLPLDKIIISFGTADNANVVKGFSYLQDALNAIHNESILLCVYGSDYDEELVKKLRHPIRFLGRLGQEQVAVANAASDLFVSPTLSESFGLTLLENIKCGTPVLSTNVTAVPEIVKDGLNGYLVEPKDSLQIIKAILSFIDKPICIEGTCDNIFSDKNIIKQHVEIINKALSNKC